MSSISRLCVPRCVERFADGNNGSVTIDRLAFESDAKLREICTSRLQFWSQEVVWLPRSVEVLGGFCFHQSWMQHVFFEPGSNLRRIEQSCFGPRLKSITIPKNVDYIDPSAFAAIPTASISIEAGNRRFSICGTFLVDIIDSKAVRYFGGHCVKNCDTIKVLGPLCFSGCHLKEFCLPRSIEIIQQGCFKDCVIGVLTFEAESRLVRIEPSSFAVVLGSVCVPGSLVDMGEGLFAGASIGALTFESATRIGPELFEGASIESVLIPASVEVIGYRCFAGCQLGAFTFEPESRLVRIEGSCFAGASIQAICIPRSVEILGDSCFEGVHGETIDFEDVSSVTPWISGLLHYVARVRTEGFVLTFEDDSRLRTIGACCFKSAFIESICIPRSVEVLGAFCFSEAKRAIGRTRSGDVIQERPDNSWACECCSQSIERELDESCEALSVTFENESKLTRIEAGSFSHCSIESICIPRSVQSLGASCFEGANGGARNILNVAGDDGNPVKEFPDAFAIEFESDSELERIEEKCFANCSLTFICLPRSLNFVGDSAFQGVPREALALEEGNARFAIDGDIFADVSDGRAVTYVGRFGLVTIQKSITILGKFCFQGAMIQSFRFEAGSALVAIEDSCFYGSHIDSIDIPGSVESLGKLCFSAAVVTVLRFEENSRLKRIEGSCFQCCQLMGSICIPRSVEVLGERCFYGARFQGVTIESDSRLRRIEDFCFQYSALKSIVLPASVTHIGEGAFDGHVIVTRS
jgi:hypothetical protein